MNDETYEKARKLRNNIIHYKSKLRYLEDNKSYNIRICSGEFPTEDMGKDIHDVIVLLIKSKLKLNLDKSEKELAEL